MRRSVEDVVKIRRERVQQTFKLDPTVMITLKGKEYTLELNNYGVKQVLKDTGFNIMKDGFGQEQMQDPEVMGSLLFRALETNHPDLTQDLVDRLYSYRLYPYILEKMRTVLDLFMPDMSDVLAEQTPDGGPMLVVEDPTQPQTLAG